MTLHPRLADRLADLDPAVRALVTEWAAEWKPDGVPTRRTVPLALARRVCEAVQRLRPHPTDLAIDPEGAVYITREVTAIDNRDGSATVSVSWSFGRDPAPGDIVHMSGLDGAHTRCGVLLDTFHPRTRFASGRGHATCPKCLGYPGPHEDPEPGGSDVVSALGRPVVDPCASTHAFSEARCSKPAGHGGRHFAWLGQYDSVSWPVTA